MYRGLLPKGLTEADLSSDDEEEADDDDQDTEDREKLGEHGGSGTSNNNNTNISGADSSSHTSPTVQEHESILPGISQETWQKFKELQKKKNEIKETKDFRRRRRRHKKGTINKDSTEEREHQTEPEKHWDELTQYFGVNDRFQPPACSKPPPKSGLEKSIDGAIAEGDIAKAEEMSDRLATRELGVKIAQAADCRDYVEHKQEEEASQAARKRKNQITWGFEAKRRWETKSNMGYM